VLAAIIQPTVPIMILIVGVVSWLVPARLVRGETLSLKIRDYVEAARGGGATRRWLVFRHIVPNAIGTIIVNATFQVADAIILVAYLSFLGLGIPPPATNWGEMLSDGLNYAFSGYWWLIFPPGLAIVLTVMAVNYLGDGLRDAFEVRLRRR
jgi:peptide/nickel transport system permease protein